MIASIFDLKMRKVAGETHNDPPDPLAGFKGEGEKGKRRKGKGVRRREGREGTSVPM